MTGKAHDIVRWPARALLQIGLADHHIVLYWKMPICEEPILGYLVREAGGNHPRYVKAPARTVFIDGLDPGSRFEFVVAAETAGSWSDSSPRCQARTSGVSHEAQASWDRKLSVDRRTDWGEVAPFLDRIRRFPLLGRDDELALGKQMEKEGVRGPAFWRFVNSNIRLVVHWARKSQRRADGSILDLGDLIQVGYEGLIEGVERWDWRKGYKFSTYGSWWIRQKISREIANRARTIRIPVHLWDRMSVALDTAEELPSDFRHDPSARAELADLTGFDADEIELISSLADPPLALHAVLSTLAHLDGLEEDKCIGDDAWIWRAYEDDPGSTAPGLRFDPGSSWQRDHAALDALERVIESASGDRVLRAVMALPARSRTCIALRYGLDGYEEHTLAGVGRAIGLTRERARQIIHEAEEAIRISFEAREA